MDQDKIIAAFFEKEIRPETIIHVGTQCLLDSWPDEAEGALTDGDEGPWEAMGIKEPEGISSVEDIAFYLRRKGVHGFLVRFATPVLRNVTATGHSFSWGTYTLKWFYAETYDAACEKAIEWRDKYMADARSAA